MQFTTCSERAVRGLPTKLRKTSGDAIDTRAMGGCSVLPPGGSQQWCYRRFDQWVPWTIALRQLWYGRVRPLHDGGCDGSNKEVTRRNFFPKRPSRESDESNYTRRDRPGRLGGLLLLAVGCCCWLGCWLFGCWLLLLAVGCCCWLLALAVGCWPGWLLAVGCWPLLLAVGCLLLLLAVGCFRVLD